MMIRRNLLGSAFAFLSLSSTDTPTYDPPEICKATPSSSSWPSHQKWNALNTALDGRLITPTPPGAVCHPDQPSYNTEQCTRISQAWTSYDFHVKDPVSVMWDNVANYTCLPNSKLPCSDQGYPAFVVNATTAKHVKLAVDFGEPAPQFSASILCAGRADL